MAHFQSPSSVSRLCCSNLEALKLFSFSAALVGIANEPSRFISRVVLACS